MTLNEIYFRTQKQIFLYRTPLAGAVLLILFAFIAFFAFNRPNKKIAEAMSDVVSLSEEVRRNYHNRPDYWGLSTESIVKNKVVPDTRLQNGRLTSPIEAEIVVGSGSDGAMVMPGMKSFDIAYKNLSTKDCIELAAFPLSAEHNLGLLSVTIKNGNEENVFSWGGENGLPIAKKEAAKICRASSAVIWNFE